MRWGRTRGGYNGDSNPEGGSAVLLRIRVRDGHSDRSRKHAARLNRRAVAARPRIRWSAPRPCARMTQGLTEKPSVGSFRHHRRFNANGESLVDIGRSYGVSHSTISRLEV